ncbi:MAG: cation:proton antiporter [Clostridia bacterium]|nr:cation:proton antiporter [Clostridia bacterium]
MEYYDLLLPLALILLFSKLLAKGCNKFNLPSVVGLILTGLLLSGVTYIPGQTVFSPEVLEGLGFLAKIGVVLIMFETGLDTDVKQIRDVGVGAVTVTVAGVVLPMALGFTVAVFFHGGFETLTHESLVSCLFYGTILTATSISVSVATLRELGKQNTKVGSVIVTAAVLDDIIGVVVLSFVIAMKNTASAASALAPFFTIGKIVLFFVFAVPLGMVLNKFFTYLDRKYPHHRLIPIFSLAVCFLFAYVSEKFFGVADITGAYVAGVSLARNPDRGYIERRSDIMSYMIFTPVFFANIGLTIKFSGIGASMIFFGLCFIAAGIVGKVCGCGLTARAFGYSRREALRIGVGMMARAEVALVCAQKGVENGIIDSSIMPFILILIICTSLITPITLRMTYKKEDMQPGE